MYVNSLAKAPPILQFFVSSTWVVVALIVLGLSAVFSLTSNLLQKWQLRRASQRARKHFAEHLMPAIKAIEDVTGSQSKEHARSLKDRTIDFLKDTIDAEATRACFYDLDFIEGESADEDSDTSDSLDAEPRRVLTWDGQYRGRTDAPKHKQYVEDDDDPVSKANFEALDSGEPRLVSNTRKSDPAVERNDNYETFLNTPVASDGQPIGLLTIDASRRGTINPDDVAVARVGSLILGIAITRLKRKNTRERGPHRTR
ncbi:GAF domain-containing protein [Brevibacterium pigmentatum]|uniref:GAF domain-containing protein n=1 Tax=Brevibacterium pigmentatum TaxID=1496080 RepID=UPI001420F779|nr:GAF domain-containing protein [Brevibacterium pigmentatum]